MDFKIRNASTEDLSRIVSLCEAHAKYEGTYYDTTEKVEKLLKMLFSPNSRLHCLVATVNHEIIGYTTFSIECSTWEADYYVNMDCLFISEDYRGNGIGEALIQEIKLFSKQIGVNHLEWQTPIFNDRAIKFYSGLGAIGKEKIRFTLHTH